MGFGLLFIFGASCLTAQGADNPALKPIINHFAARNYSTAQVTKAELDLIIQAGVRAPSAGNRQPWYFTVVQDEALAKRVLSQATEGNTLIVISGAGDNKTNGAMALDCGLATQSIYLAAQALGLGSRIYTNPIDNINSRLKSELGLPANYNAVAVVRIGRLQAGVDAVSSASSRSGAEQKVNYK
jgi:nitroreductase